MLYNKQLLPLVTIKKVSVFKNNKFSYGVDFSLSRFSQETSEDFKNQIKNITDKLKIVFVVLHSETERYLAGFQSDALRHKALMEFKRDHSSFVKEISFTDFIQKSDSNTLNTAGSTTHQIQEFTGTEIIETEALSPRVENNINNVSSKKHQAIADIVPVHYEIKVNDNTIAILYKDNACHNYHLQ